jgi:hypothetical protein
MGYQLNKPDLRRQVSFVNLRHRPSQYFQTCFIFQYAFFF